ncbi:MAG: LysM peptidoglycan-binding domain-containing protein [Kiritimatiellae bacterium]|nr:LysM peptidoglycan-binding domain-containing protein [Kiritimatiellia bacterium]
MRAMHINQIKNEKNGFFPGRVNLMSRKQVVFLLAGLMACGSGCDKHGIAAVENTERTSVLYRKAFTAEQSGDLDEAIHLYNRLLVEEPKSFSAHFQLATLLHDHAEDYIGAVYHYKQYLYLRPETEKSTLAQDRIRIAEQLLAPQILKKVGDSVQGISQAHLLKENERLNRIITALEGEKSVLMEAKTAADKELGTLRGDNTRLRELLQKMRVNETVSEPARGLTQRAGDAMRSVAEEEPITKTDTKSLRALRKEAMDISENGVKTQGRKPLVEVPSTEAVLKKVQTRLTGSPETPVTTAHADATEKKDAEPVSSRKIDKTSLSALSLFGKEDKKENNTKTRGEQKTYVVQPGDTLFRVAEKFYGDSMGWKKIRDANRTRIDPDGRIRAGQIIVVP